MLTAILTNPLWVIKTNMLSHPLTDSTAFPSMTAGLRSVVQTYGPRGLFRGLVPAMFGVTHGAVQFTFYERLKRWRGGAGVMNWKEYIACSAGAKVGAGILTYPYKVVQTRCQNFETVYEGPKRVVVRLWREEGIRGFYKGYVSSVSSPLYYDH